MIEEFPGVLDPDRDKILIQGINQYARAAGLGGNPEFIWRSFKDHPDITLEDVKLAKVLPNLKTRKPGVCGVYYDGLNLAGVSEKFMSMTGLMVRNYIDARYSPMGEIIKSLMEGEPLESRIVFIPDFFISVSKNEKQKTARSIPEWKKEMILSTLISMQAENRILVIAVSDFEEAMTAYGTSIKQFIETKFIEVRDSEDE